LLWLVLLVLLPCRLRPADGGKNPGLLGWERSVDSIRCYYRGLLGQLIFHQSIVKVIRFETRKVDVGGGDAGLGRSRRWSKSLRLLLSLGELDRVVL
jgi:hypothetical protein